jgi:CO/xanthine dehydrogenase FAD-binding subunit
MDLHTITELKHPAAADEIRSWREGYAWLAGGTWLLSEPQPGLDTLIALDGMGWRPLQVTADGLEIAATCKIVELYDFEGPAEWSAWPLLRLCCDAFLASFKIWNMATVGGNLCMSLPASPMVSLAAALEGKLTLWPREGDPREMAALDFVIGNHMNRLGPGELLRSLHLPATALRKRFAFRHGALTHLGRSAALIIGTRTAEGPGDLLLTITAATPRPIQLHFDRPPSAAELRDALDDRIAADGWFEDVNGSAAYKRHLTYHFAEQIRGELAGPEAGA